MEAKNDWDAREVAYSQVHDNRICGAYRTVRFRHHYDGAFQKGKLSVFTLEDLALTSRLVERFCPHIRTALEIDKLFIGEYFIRKRVYDAYEIILCRDAMCMVIEESYGVPQAVGEVIKLIVSRQIAEIIEDHKCKLENA